MASRDVRPVRDEWVCRHEMTRSGTATHPMAGRAPSARTIGTVVLLLVALSACGGSKSKAQKASDALNAGLKAQVAGNLSAAAGDYQKVLDTDPKNKYAYYNLGLIAQTQGDAATAEKNYRLTLGIDRNFVPALFNLAIIRSNAQATSEAIDLYKRVISLDDSQAGAHFNLGLLLRQTFPGAAAEAEIAKAVQLDPSLASRAGSPPKSATSGTG
jgi:tetratricopeptide (TPR) repeat protein